MYKLCIAKQTRDYIRNINISRQLMENFIYLYKIFEKWTINYFSSIFEWIHSDLINYYSLLIKSKIDRNYTHQIPISAAERLAIIIKRCEYKQQAILSKQ